MYIYPDDTRQITKPIDIRVFIIIQIRQFKKLVLIDFIIIGYTKKNVSSFDKRNQLVLPIVFTKCGNMFDNYKCASLKIYEI